MTVHERIIIENFAGIKHLDIPLGQINVFIGPQATGKSVCAKVIFYFKTFMIDMLNAIVNKETKRQFDAGLLKKFKTYFPPTTLGQGIFKLRYEIGDMFIQIDGIKTKLALSYSNYYKNELNTEKARLKKQLENHDIAYVISHFNTNQINKLGTIISSYGQVFIPAGRSFFSILQSNIFYLLSNNVDIDPFIIEFGRIYEISKRLNLTEIDKDNEHKNLTHKIDLLGLSILKGKFIQERNKEFLLLDDGREVHLSNLSSGQQEILPLAIVLKGILLLDNGYGYTIYIEEPEAHLFPSAQKKVVELIATIFNMSNKPMQFVITTHSPYLLTAFNNLIHAGNVASSLTAEDLTRLNEIVPTEQQLKTENVKVYALGHGTCDDLMSKETGLISTNEIDQVSDDLATQFDSILDMEYNHVENS